MRRLALVFTVCALALLGASSAGAARSGPHLTIKGAAHEDGGNLNGGFTVENIGTALAPARTATVKLVGAPLNLKVKVTATVQHASVHSLPPGAKQRIKVKASMPAKAKSGNWTIYACAGGCARIGRLSGGSGERTTTSPNAPASPPASTPGPPAATPAPPCAPSTGPIAHPVEEPFRHVGECGDEYFGFVPDTYDPSAPMPLLVWMHGCGGEAEGDAWNVGSYTPEPGHGWLTLSLGGRDGGCWNPLAESENLVMAALADFEAHFDVDRHRVMLAGYSSGGDLAYRTGFRHSSTFAGLLIENSAPFEQTETTQAESLAAATTKLHIVHLAHEQDETYELRHVESEVSALKSAGFPVTLIKRPGTHFDEPEAIVEGKRVPGTDADVQTYLLPHIEDGWTSP
jgi:pimeloyl-ACP methyl ester carboxylesterase